MVGAFDYQRSLPDIPAFALVSPASLADYLEPFTSHTGPKAFEILAWIYTAIHFCFLGGVFVVIGLLLKSGRFQLFRTVNGRHGIVIIHNVVDVPLCLIVIFLSYDAIFWIISLVGYKSDFAQINWQVLHWIRYVLLATTGFYFMTGVAAVWPFSPSTMRYPWLWNLVMVSFLPCAVLATIPPMVQANTAWNHAWHIYKGLRNDLLALPSSTADGTAPGVPDELVATAKVFLLYTSKYAYKHAIVAIILVIFCALAATVFSVIGWRVARIVWQDVQTRRARSKRDMRMARAWSRPSLSMNESATTSKGFASVGSVDWSSQHDPDGARSPTLGHGTLGSMAGVTAQTAAPIDGGEDGNMTVEIKGTPPMRCDSALPLRINTQNGLRGGRQGGARNAPPSEDAQRQLRLHFYRTLILFVTMWAMIASLVCSGLYFTLWIYPSTRQATPDAVFGNSALRTLCIFHIVEFVNITFFGSIFIGTLVIHRVVALRRGTEKEGPATLFKERTVRPITHAQARPAPGQGYTFAIGQVEKVSQSTTMSPTLMKQQGYAFPPQQYQSQHHHHLSVDRALPAGDRPAAAQQAVLLTPLTYRSPNSATTPTFGTPSVSMTPFSMTPPLTPMLGALGRDKEDEDGDSTPRSSA